jgi:diacylglycerol kinase (ATP)
MAAIRARPRALALINPNSGAAAAHAEWLHLCEDWGGQVCAAASERELCDAFDEARRVDCNRLIVVGGDGSVSRVVNALHECLEEIELAIVPAGTGNDLARSLNLPIDDPLAAWEIALAGVACRTDLVACRPGNLGLFVNSITAGFGGRQAAQEASEQKSFWGRIAYWIAAISQIGEMPEFDLVLHANGRIQQIRSIGFWLANGRSVGGGFPIAPSALLDDGLLDVVVVPSVSALELLATGVDAALSGPEQSDSILTFRASHLEARSSVELPLSIDGEPCAGADLECHVLPKALRIVAGPMAPAVGNGVLQ